MLGRRGHCGVRGQSHGDDQLNVESVQSITSSDPLVISGGGLTVTANSTISGGLDMTGGTLTADGSNVSLTVTGSTTVAGASLVAEGGATLTLSQISSYSSGSGITTNPRGHRHWQRIVTT